MSAREDDLPTRCPACLYEGTFIRTQDGAHFYECNENCRVMVYAGGKPKK